MAKKEREAGVYSHSRLWLYENCPEFYKLKYVDGIELDLPVHSALVLGSVVHEALEWLYHQVKNRIVEIDELIEYFGERWKITIERANGSIRFENGDEQNSFNKGVKFLVDYYMRHRPFNQKVLAIERKILFPLDSEGKYKIQGFIDRLDFNDKEGVYEVHDYKTNAYPKKQEEVDADRQLALYHLGLKEIYGKEIKVKLIWHFLSHNLDLVSQRSEEELDKLMKDTLALIKQIESETEWSACGKKFCDWCDFKRIHKLQYEDVLRIFKEKEKETYES